MDLSFYPLTLEAIDAADAESLALFVAADERPLTGLAGLADWRLSGRLSRFLRNGLVTGSAGEALLTPPGTRLSFRKLFVFGLGPSNQGEDELVAQLGDGLRRLGAAGVQDAAMQIPSRLSVEVGIRVLIDELQGPRRALVFGPDPAKLVSALSHAAARGAGAAQLERRVVKVPAKTLPPLPVKPPQPARPAPAQQLPRASPLPFAPSAHAMQQGPAITPLPPVQIPKASPLSFQPSNAADAPLARVQQTSPPPVNALPSEARASALAPAIPAAALPAAAVAQLPAPPAAPVAPPAFAPPAPQSAAPVAEARAPAAPAAPAPAKSAPPEKPATVLKPPPPPPARFVPPPPKPAPAGKGKKRRR